jgi:hypothetical protein
MSTDRSLGGAPATEDFASASKTRAELFRLTAFARCAG